MFITVSPCCLYEEFSVTAPHSDTELPGDSWEEGGASNTPTQTISIISSFHNSPANFTGSSFFPKFGQFIIFWRKRCVSVGIIVIKVLIDNIFDISGKMGEVGVPDMVTISDIDEFVINKNLKKRYSANKIYVSINMI